MKLDLQLFRCNTGVRAPGQQIHAPTMKPPLPNRRVKLALWWMLYHVPIEVDLAFRRDWQITAAAHLKWDMETFEDMTRVFPQHWQRMLGKRARRFNYFKQHGDCPDGWTPPAKGEIARPAPVIALMLRCNNEDQKLMCLLKHMTNRQRTTINGLY